MTEDEDWVDRIMREGEVAQPEWVVHKLAADGSVGNLNYMIFCPACKCGHGFDDRRWTFNGDMVKPTLLEANGSGKRSVITQFWNHKEKRNMQCHFNIDNGMIFFHGDSQHHMAGQTVPLEPF